MVNSVSPTSSLKKRSLPSRRPASSDTKEKVQKRRSPTTQKVENLRQEVDGAKLVSVHRQVLQNLLAPRSHPGSKQEILRKLRRRRMALLSQLEEKRRRMSSGRNVGDDLRKRKRDAAEEKERPYLKVWSGLTRSSSKIDGNGISSNKLVSEALDQQELAQRMRKVRHIRKLAAAYRLAGVSILPCPDKEVLALRFDILVDGSFVACYHCFFDLVVKVRDSEEQEDDMHSDDEDHLHLRLVQHTLPSSIPLKPILQNTMGGVASIGPYGDDSMWKAEELMKRLRRCANDIYQACYCYCVRKHCVAYLKSLVHNEATSPPDAVERCSLQSLECSETDFRRMSFSMFAGVSSLHVSLAYKDPLRVQPTHVTVKDLSSTPKGGSAHNRFAMEISDDEDDDNDHGAVQDDLVENATAAFRMQPIQIAIKSVSSSMLECW